MTTALQKPLSICWINFDSCPCQSNLSGTLALKEVSLSICLECYRFDGSEIKEHLAEILEAGYPTKEEVEKILGDSDNETLLKNLDYGDEHLPWTIITIWQAEIKNEDIEGKKKAETDILTAFVKALLEIFDLKTFVKALLEESSLKEISETLFGEMDEDELLLEALEELVKKLQPTGLTEKRQNQINAAFVLLKNVLNSNPTVVATEK